MKRVLWALVLIGATALAYRWFTSWTAYKTYEKFADAWARENKTEAVTHADAATVRHAFEERSLRGTRPGMVMEAFRGTSYSLESKTRLPGGDIEFRVLQTIFFDPPGVTSAIGGAMLAHFRHIATVRRSSHGGRVVAFEPTFVDMAETRARKP